MKSVIPVFLILSFFNILSQEQTYTISMMGNEIGKSVEKWSENKDAEGKCVLTLESISKMSLKKGDYSINIQTKSLIKATCGDFSPVSIESESDEMSSKMTSKAANSNGLFSGVIEKNGNKEFISVTIPHDTTFLSMIFKKFPESILLKGGTAKVISEESLTLKNISYSAVKEANGLLKVTVNYDGVQLVFLLDKGVVVSSDLQNGIISYKLDGHSISTQKTTNSLRFSSGSSDVLINSAIPNKGISVKKPRAAVKMNFSVSGNSISAIPSTCFQKKFNGDTLITVDHTSILCKDLPAPQDTKGNIFEDSTNSSIIATAKKVVNGAPNRNEMIKRMVNFVFSHIKNKNYSHVNLSAGEVLEKRAGDCTEHATLLSALLKSVGIPVKMVSGLALDNKGGFILHNWNEAYGDNGWMTVDPTFGTIRSDAARILLMYGGGDSNSREQVSLAALKFLDSLEISVTGFVNE